MEDIAETYNNMKGSTSRFRSSGPSRKDRHPSKEKCVNKFKRLLANPRLGMVSLECVGDRKAFRVKNSPNDQSSGKTYSGLTRRLEKVFYPTAAAESPAEAKRRRSKGGAPNLLKRAKSSCPSLGKEHGILVHKQIEEFTNTIAGNLTIEHFKVRNPDQDPCFKRFVSLCARKGWVPVASELAVYDEDIGVATSVDVLALDTNTAEMVLIEVKTSYEATCFDSHPSDPRMEEPLGQLRDCPLQRAVLQALVTCLIVEKKYHVVPDRCFVVRICPKQGLLELYSPSWSMDRETRSRVYHALVAYNTAKKAGQKRSSGDRAAVFSDLVRAAAKRARV